MDSERPVTRHRSHPPDTSTSSTSPASRKVFLHPKQLHLLKALDRRKAQNPGLSIVSVKLSNPEPKSSQPPPQPAPHDPPAGSVLWHPTEAA